MASNIDSAMEQSRAIVEAMMREFTEAQVALHGDCYADIIESSPVRYGGYRARNVSAVGDARPQERVFEMEGRPGNDEPYVGEVLPAPDVSAQRAAMASAAEFGDTLWIENGSYYSHYLEYGTALMAPRLVYESAGQRAAARAEAVASALSAKRVE